MSKRGLEFEPGCRWAYSSYGFVVLGAVIENVTGRRYDDYIQQHVYAPAGMTRSGSLPEDHAIPDRSSGYTKPPGTTAWLPNTDTLPCRRRLFDRRGPRTVRPRAAQPQTPQPRRHQAPGQRKTNASLTPGGRYAYGFEDARGPAANGWVGHGGVAPGMNGDLRIYLKSGYVIAVLANIDPPAAQRISEYLNPRLPTQR